MMHSVCLRLAFAAVLVVSAAAAARADAKKFVAFAWEFSRMSVRDLSAYADELDKTPLDGIGIYLNEPTPDGGRVSTHNIMHVAWRRDVLVPLVPVARKLAAHKSMRESFIGTFRAPFGHRIEWNDDDGWARVASNMTIAAWFAKTGGLRGISMDPEDYHCTAQFVRQGDDEPYETLVAMARRRGRQVFEGVFREYPDICILSFWFLSMDHVYLGSERPERDARERGFLWPAFVDGILDVMPATARIVDGCEHSYRYESSRGDFYNAADAIRRRLPVMLSPENRVKYQRQVNVSFGLYLDMFTNPEGSNWYFGPVNGSRLVHFERNLVQAARAADEYVWFWGERHCWADWRGKGPEDSRNISAETWNHAVPGLEDAIIAVKSPAEFAKMRGKAMKASGRFSPMNENSECRTENGKVPQPYSTWQQKKNRQGRLYGDMACGEGDKHSLAAEGVENGSFSIGFGRHVTAGERFVVSLSMLGEGGSASVCWKRGSAWDWNICSPVQVRFGGQGNEGWRHGRAVVRVPEGVDGCGLIMSVRQGPMQKCWFDNVAIYSLGMPDD